MFSLEEMLPLLTTFLSAAFMMLVGPVLRELMHPLIRDYLTSIFFRRTFIIEDKAGPESNRIFEAATIYLRTKVGSSTRCLKVCQTNNQQRPIIDFVKGEEIHDSFENIELKWKLCEKGKSRQKFFELVFDKRFEKTVQDSYFDHVKTRSNEIQEEGKVIKYYIHPDGGEWVSVNPVRSATFENLAIDPKERRKLKGDLDWFVNNKEQYKKVGKTWKRGYLLYGPPGTGKSSLIAAMANYLRFDIYDLNLSDIHSDSELRSILLSTSKRAIIAFEDIDCGAQLAGRAQKFTRSGLLNLIDGLCSSCGDERIIVFTTNHKEKLEKFDPALLRPGRIDVHVHMSYLTMDGFKQLVSVYLGINGDHQLYGPIESLLENVEVTPAEIAEELLKSDDTNVVLRGLVEFLKQKLLPKEKAAELKELLKSDDDTDVDVEGFVKFLKQKKLKNAKAAEAEQLFKSDHTDDINVGLAKAPEAKCINTTNLN